MAERPTELDIFSRRVGKTPLLRARKLEELVGIKEIYLKLEGTNPKGHKSDRIAKYIIRDVQRSDKNTLTIGTMGYLARSLTYLAEPMNIKCVFFVPKLTSKLIEEVKDQPHVEIIETGGQYEKAVSESRRQAQENGWYDANVGLGNTFLGMLAYAPISREIVSSLGTVPDTVSASVGEGTLMSGVHQGFRQLWGEEEVEKMPRLLGGSLAGKNSIIWAYKKGMSGVEPLQSHSGKTGPRVSALVNTSGSNGQPALNAIYDTNGMGCSFSEEELAEFKRMLKNAEGIHLTIDSAAAFGPLLRAKEEGIVGEGKHVVILSTGHTNLDIRFLEKKMFEEGYASLIKTLDTWLERFSDPLEEIKEALDNAFEEGYVLGASLGGRLVGLCILSRMELDTFFPRYHLSYIAADKRYAGRGVATELMEKAIEVSDGELSLHVEPDNKRAIRLYKKMGLDVQYYRMKYRNGDADAS